MMSCVLAPAALLSVDGEVDGAEGLVVGGVGAGLDKGLELT